MKPNTQILKKTILLLLLAFTLGCDKDDDNKTSQSLPEATQTGRGIFACLVDGKPFIDKSGSPNAISFNAYYQLIDGEYYFGIGGQDDKVNDIIFVGLSTNQLSINENESYALLDGSIGTARGVCDFFPNANLQELSATNSTYTGELNITKLDIDNQIISGTFWFDIQDPFTGERVEIREGRFDTRFGL